VASSASPRHSNDSDARRAAGRNPQPRTDGLCLQPLLRHPGRDVLGALPHFRGRQSFTPRNIVLPVIASGIKWGITQAAWLEANRVLSIVVAFPIVSSLPGMVALAWGMLCFGELQRARIRRFAAARLLVRLAGVLLIAFSNRKLSG